jgi:hypothetical protein
MKAPGLVKIAAPKEGSVRKGAIASVIVGQKSTKKYAEMDPQAKNTIKIGVLMLHTKNTFAIFMLQCNISLVV